jgi:hypothetical protein
MGVRHFGDYDRVRVIVWACAVMTRSGGRSTSVRTLFPGGGRTPSTVFNRCLAEGRPWPDFVRADSSRGTALEIEDKYPGTLIWLVHPLWDAIAMIDAYTMANTYLELFAMRPTVQDILFASEDGPIDWAASVKGAVQPLHEEGSLDALLALLLLCRQVYCLPNHDAYAFIAPKILKAIQTIECLQWMPRPVHELVIQLLSLTVMNQQPPRSTLTDARLRRKKMLANLIEEHTGKPISKLDEDIELALEGTGKIKTTRYRVQLPKSAMEIVGRTSELVNAIIRSA